MAKVNEGQRRQLIELLEAGKDIPQDYKYLLFPPERQEYELIYTGKEREEDILAETMAVPLQPVRAFGGDDADWRNILIFGDNLQAMKTLLRMKNQGQLLNSDGSRGAKLVYIDPPFATKQEFQSGNGQVAYRDRIAGAEFLEFLRQRLVFIREILAPNGSLFVHMDQRKGHYLKAILDDVMGERNFRNEIILPGRASKNLQQQFSTISRLNVRHDSLYWYSRSTQTRFSPLWVTKHKEGNPEGHWHHFWSTADRRTMRYELFGITPETGQWTWEEKRAKRAIENCERYLAESGGRTLAEYWRDTGCALEFVRQDAETESVQYWRAPAKLRIADTVWAGVPVYDNKTGYPTEKNEALLAQIIDLASEKEDIVLDAFAGSGTTLVAAEKLGRRWIGIDSGKLAVYTMQKRLLSVKSGSRNSGRPIKAAPFTLCNAGLYDFSRLRKLPWEGWRFFALNLFQCRDEPHKVGGIQLDGFRGGHDVLVFNHLMGGGVVLDYGFIEDLHAQIGSRVGSRFFIVAPAASVVFLEDYVDHGQTRYYVLRIPYSIINELHTRDFEALTQPTDESQVNDPLDVVGFAFIRPPKVECEYVAETRRGQMFLDAVVRIKTFKSEAMAKGAGQKENLETLSMILVDYDYPYDPERRGSEPPPPFELDAVYYANAIKDAGWEVRMPLDSLGRCAMLIYIDCYGNEYTELKAPADFQPLEAGAQGLDNAG